MTLQELHNYLDTIPEEAYRELEDTLKDLKRFYKENYNFVVLKKLPKKITKVKIVTQSVSKPSMIEE